MDNPIHMSNAALRTMKRVYDHKLKGDLSPELAKSYRMQLHDINRELVYRGLQVSKPVHSKAPKK